MLVAFAGVLWVALANCRPHCWCIRQLKSTGREGSQCTATGKPVLQCTTKHSMVNTSQQTSPHQHVEPPRAQPPTLAATCAYWLLQLGTNSYMASTQMRQPGQQGQAGIQILNAMMTKTMMDNTINATGESCKGGDMAADTPSLCMQSAARI